MPEKLRSLLRILEGGFCSQSGIRCWTDNKFPRRQSELVY